MSKEKAKKGPTPRKRLFTNEFRIGDQVAIIRTEHGWYDGGLEGRITCLADYVAEVTDEHGIVHEINHPRDIYKSKVK